MKKNYPENEEIERTFENSKFLNFKKGEKLRQLFLRNDVILLASVFEKIKKESV